METSTGIIIGKVAFYLALTVLAVVIILKKIKQTRNAKRDDHINPNN